jgi:hypothetical protein
MRSFFEYLRNHLFVVLLVFLVGGFVALAVSQRASTPSKQDVQIPGVKTYTLTDRTHVSGSVKYDQVPPVGGKHNPVWAECDGKVYDHPIRNENAVHSLEHGAVWITYQPGLDQASIDKLAKKVQGSNYTMMSPYPDQPGKIMLTAWDHQLAVDSASDPRIDQFLQKYRLGPQTQEPGASCQAVQGGM